MQRRVLSASARSWRAAGRPCPMFPTTNPSTSTSTSSGSSFSMLPMGLMACREMGDVAQCSERNTLVLAETVANQQPGSANSASFRPSLANAVAAAAQFNDPVTVLLGGTGVREAAEQVARIEGVNEVMCLESPDLAQGLAEPWTAALLWAQQEQGFSRIIASSSAFSRSLLPRVAALLDCPMASDVVRINGPNEFVRPIYAGNAMATVRCLMQDSKPVFLTVRSTSFPGAALGDSPAKVMEISLDLASIPQASGPLQQALAVLGRSRWLTQEVGKADRPDLSAAKVVVSGGRGLKSAQGFAMLEELADKLGGAVGASRAAVDAGFVPNELQVGQTGKVVAPDLYIAIGISGAIQHLAGIKDSKTIVAINKDGDAPIFQVSDFGLVADLFDAVPELVSKVKSRA